MDATGTLYLAKTPPLATTAADGTFALTLLAYDRIGPYKVEPWRITYAGAWANVFWQAHRGDLTPGQPIRVTARELRTFTSAASRGVAAEIHARVTDIQLLPRAHSEPAGTGAQRANSPALSPTSRSL